VKVSNQERFTNLLQRKTKISIVDIDVLMEVLPYVIFISHYEGRRSFKDKSNNSATVMNRSQEMLYRESDPFTGLVQARRVPAV
jgi:hypothetical protein